MHDSGASGVDRATRPPGTGARRADRTSDMQLSNITGTASVQPPLRAPHRRHHHHQPPAAAAAAAAGLQQQYTVASSYLATHLTLPRRRSRGAMTSQPEPTAGARAAGRHVSPSHFSWPGTSFDLAAGLPVDNDIDEGRSSEDAATTQGGGEPTSPSLPSSTSTATNTGCTRPPASLLTPGHDVTPSEDTEIADVTTRSADNGDVTTGNEESGPMIGSGGLRRRRRSCEFNLLDDDDSWSAAERGRDHDDVTGPEWAWSTATTTESDWVDVMCVNDDNATPTAAAAAGGVDDEDEDDEMRRSDVVERAATAINETVMKCIESCDKVLLRHSTAIR